MSWQDRPYSGEDERPGRSFGGGGFGGAGMRLGFPPITPVVKKILIVNVAIFVVRAFLPKYATQFGPMDAIGGIFCMSVDAVLHGQIWRLVSYQYLHSLMDPFHIMFNMLALYFLGVHLERLWGGRRFFVFYTVAGLLGALFLTVLVLIGWLGDGPMVGASGSVLGCLGAVAVLLPSMVVFLFIFPVPIRMAATIFVAIYVFNLIGKGPNAGGDAAHLAGLAFGVYWTLYGQRHFQRIRAKQTEGAWARKVQRQADEEKPVDEILDKIQREGMDSLSGREKQILKNASAKQREREGAYGRTDQV
jgi:membrane associated rhomboid family serine protease